MKVRGIVWGWRITFIVVFENYEVFNFVKLAEEVEKAKSHRITEMFDIQEKLHKIKVIFEKKE